MCNFLLFLGASSILTAGVVKIATHRSPQAVRAQSFQANQQEQEDGMDLAIARSLSNVRSPQTVRAQSFQANQQVQEDGMDLAIARSLSDRQVSQASTQSSAERLREKQTASLARSNSLREKNDLEEALRNSLRLSNAAPQVPRGRTTSTESAPEPWLEVQLATYCGKHTVNAILVATGICTQYNVPDVSAYQTLRSGMFEHQDLDKVLDEVTVARNPQRPYTMFPIDTQAWNQIGRSTLPAAAEAFVVNNQHDLHWYAIVSSRRPDGTRIWWNADSIKAGVGNNRRPIRIGTDRELARELVSLMPSNLNGRVTSIPRGNPAIKQVLAVTYNADKVFYANRRREDLALIEKWGGSANPW